MQETSNLQHIQSDSICCALELEIKSLQCTAKASTVKSYFNTKYYFSFALKLISGAQ